MLTKSDLNQISDIIDRRLTPVEKRVDKRFAAMDKRLIGMDKRLIDMDKRLGSMEDKMDQVLHYSKTVADELVITQKRVDNHETRITKLEKTTLTASA